MSVWIDQVRDILRSTDEVKVVLEAVFIPSSAPNASTPDPRLDGQNKRILAVISHKDDWDLSEEGCVFVCKAKKSGDGELEELEIHRVLPIYGNFSIVMSQMRRSTIDLRAGLQKAAVEQPRSGFSLAVTPAEGLEDDAKPALFYIKDVQELRDFVAESRRLKEESSSIEADEPINIVQSTTHFSWLRPYILKHISPFLLASLPSDLRVVNQPIQERLSPASAGQPGDDYADLHLLRDEWVRSAARSACRTDKKSLRLRIGTFNVNGKLPSQDLSSWIQGNSQPSLPPLDAVSPFSVSDIIGDPFDKQETVDPIDQEDPDPDLFVLGFQEIDLSTEALIYSMGTAREDAWCAAVFAALGEKASKYEKLSSKQLVGMLIVVIVKKSLQSCFSDVQAVAAGAGILGVMGNKGGTAIRVSFTAPSATNVTILTFVNAHLAAFDEMVDKRNSDFHDLSKRLTFAPSVAARPDGDTELDYMLSSSGAYESDVLFWLGDLNYRLDVPDLDLRRILRDEEWDNKDKFASLLRFDQLNKAIHAKKAFVGFQEGPITHLPFGLSFVRGVQNLIFRLL
ncbi:DNase I-like protein [Coprinopsis marcescibilis]|uniref:DNase I-like protein n=1 Tax=Coprinopsis marcescibilis TaxID=230819 RepID=A0A5C3L9Q4_COPMA|nr:DNase I-like protein [Coprinopsis marcescibilis]